MNHEVHAQRCPEGCTRVNLGSSEQPCREGTIITPILHTGRLRQTRPRRPRSHPGVWPQSPCVATAHPLETGAEGGPGALPGLLHLLRGSWAESRAGTARTGTARVFPPLGLRGGAHGRVPAPASAVRYSLGAFPASLREEQSPHRQAH